MITLDFETYYSQDFSLSKVSTESYIRSPEFEVIGVSIKEDNYPTEWITGDDEYIRRMLSTYELDKQICVAHNAAFDMAILSWRYGITPKYIMDTLSMARPVIGLETSCSLRALSEHYGIGHKGTEVYNTKGKHLKDFTQEELDRFGEYCKLDVELTYKLLPHLLKGFPREELDLIDLTIRFFTDPKLELDKGLLEAHLNQVVKAREDLIASVGIDEEAFTSNDKFAELLRSEGVEPPTKMSPTTGKETYAFAKTDEDFKALLNHPNERVQNLVTARLGLKSSIEETRTRAFLEIAERGTMPIMLNYYGAVNTGRWSGGDKLNPQNLPRGGALRQSIVAPEGHIIVACDSSQVEARTLAWFAGQDDLVDDFKNGKDVYSAFASKVFGYEVNKHDHPKERFVGKSAILGLGYSVGANKLRQALKNGGVDLPLEECQRIVGIYRTTYAQIPKLWKECSRAIELMAKGYGYSVGVGVQLPTKAYVKDGKQYGEILLPNGMQLRYPDLQSSIGDKGWLEYTYQKKRFRSRIYGGAMTENIIQSLARIAVGYQMLKINELLRKRSAKMNDGKIRQVVHMVHDEVIAIVPEEEATNTERMMEIVMSTPPSWAQTLPVSCEAGKGKNYGEAK